MMWLRKHKKRANKASRKSPEMICTGCWEPLLSFGHLPLKWKTLHWEYSDFEIFLVSSRVMVRQGAMLRERKPLGATFKTKG